MFIVEDKTHYIQALRAVKYYNYNTWKLFARRLHIQFGLSYECNPYVGVSCMWVRRNTKFNEFYNVNDFCNFSKTEVQDYTI